MAPFGETVLAWRLCRSLTQVQLSALAGISRPNLCAMERGEREATLMTVRRLALALEIRPGILADGILPGEGEAGDFSRATLERVAALALRGKGGMTLREGDLAQRLRDVTLTRFGTGAGTRPLPSNRKFTRSWLLLRGLARGEVLASLIDRMADRKARDPRGQGRRSRPGDIA